MSLIGLVISLGLFIPALAVMIRRLHDIGRSGWFCLLFFIPLLGFILWIMFMVRDGEPGANDYGRPFELS